MKCVGYLESLALHYAVVRFMGKIKALLKPKMKKTSRHTLKVYFNSVLHKSCL